MLRSISTISATGLLVAAVVASSVAASEAPRGADELLPALDTEEVTPGVYRVMGDAFRDLPTGPRPRIQAGSDDSVWVLSDDRAVQVGNEKAHEWTSADWQTDLTSWVVAPDGSLQGWAWDADGAYGVASLDVPGAEAPVVPLVEPLMPFAFMPDGAAWAMRIEDPQSSASLMRLSGGEWYEMSPGPPVARVRVGHDGRLWAGLFGGLEKTDLYRFDGRSWTRIDAPERVPSEGWLLGPEGSLWAWGNYRIPVPDRAFLARLKEGEWTLWERDEVPAFKDIGMALGTSVAPDGALWVAEPIWRADGRNNLAERCNGVTRFDGESVTTFLADRCIQSMTIGPDGTVWLRANPASPTGGHTEGGPFDTFAITPEAITAAG